VEVILELEDWANCADWSRCRDDVRREAAPGQQRGVALITAVLMVALATMLAVDVGFRGSSTSAAAARCSQWTRPAGGSRRGSLGS